MDLKIVTDFDATEGDTPVFEGHTVNVDTLEFGDFDGNGNLDAVVTFVSNQGAGGDAHNGDKLGTVVILEMNVDGTVSMAWKNPIRPLVDIQSCHPKAASFRGAAFAVLPEVIGLAPPRRSCPFSEPASPVVKPAFRAPVRR